MRVIYFCGDDRVGKTTMAKSLQDIILRNHRKPTAVLSFADGVRDELIRLYGLPSELIFDKTIDKKSVEICLGDYIYEGSIPKLWKKHGLISDISEYSDVTLSLRDLYVTHGTKIRRQEDDLYWYNILKDKFSDDYAFVIIDDARSPSDFDLGDSIIYLYNDDTLNNSLPTNLEQERFRKWLSENEYRIASKIHVTIPLLKYDAEELNKKHILPLIDQMEV